jgi:hypothetical protein
MNYFYIPDFTNINDDMIRAVIFTDVKKMCYKPPHTGDIYFHLDITNPTQFQSSASEISSSICRLDRDVCVDLRFVSAGWKLALCQVVVKDCYTFTKSTKNAHCLYFQDKLRFKGMLNDAINEYMCATASRDFSNEFIFYNVGKHDNNQLSKRLHHIKSIFGRTKQLETTMLFERSLSNRPRGIAIEHNKNACFSTICITDTHGTYVSGVFRYFVKHGAATKYNFVGIVMDDADAVLSVYNPCLVLSFTTVNTGDEPTSVSVAMVECANQSLLPQIFKIGERVGERVCVKHNPTLPPATIAISVANNQLAHGVSLGINIIKALTKN